MMFLLMDLFHENNYIKKGIKQYLFLFLHLIGYNYDKKRKNVMSLPEYVKHQRKRYGLIHVELSEKSGIGLRFVRDPEQRKKSLRMDKVNQVLSLCGTESAPTTIDRQKQIN